MLEDVFERMNYKRKVVELNPQRGIGASKEHYEIFDLLMKGNREELIERVRSHIRTGKEKLVEILKNREEFIKA